MPFVAVRYHDKEHEHIHIIASRVRFDSSCVSDSWDYLKATNATRAIAAQYDLSVAPASSNAVAQDLAAIGIDAPISLHAKLYSQIKAMLKKPNSEQVYPDIPTPVEDNLVERLSTPEVEELTSNPDKDNHLPKTKKNNQIEL